MDILAVIPARGGSKGIPQKNVRLMRGKPLVYYSINNAKACSMISDIVVSTDDDTIAAIARMYGVDVIMRDKSLADDATTLDPVIHDAVVKMEKSKNLNYDIVITLQPTSPTLKSETLNDAINELISKNHDTLISAVNDPHLSWAGSEKGIYPLYDERKNRQNLLPHYRETGAFLITKRQCISENNRIGTDVSVYEVSQDESIDIDNKADWILCDKTLSKKSIVFRADGHKELGMGHIYHCLTLAHNLTEHDVIFVTNRNCEPGHAKLVESNMPIVLIENEEGFYKYLKENETDIVVNDCLDTSENHISMLKSLVGRVITIEDLGEGAKHADATINALYEKNNNNNTNVYNGKKYVCLRDEFVYTEPNSFSADVNRIAVLFGGTDPSNLTRFVYNVAIEMHDEYPGIIFDFITGIGYPCIENGIFNNEEKNINVYRDCKLVSSVLSQADLAISSQGRTTYELAVMGVPSIVLAQNEREKMHTFASDSNGFVNLGLGKAIDAETLKNTIRKLINTPQKRKDMRDKMLSHSLRNSTRQVVKIILGEEDE